MVGKDAERVDCSDEGRARVRLIAEKKRQIEDTANQVRRDISSCFERLAEALGSRERQLLRQVEAVHRQQLALVQSDSALLPAEASLAAELGAEAELRARLLDFGRIDLSNSIALKDSEPYRAEEYQEAAEDLVNFDKSLKSEADEFDVSSVMRRKRDSRGNVSLKPILINFNCASCDSPLQAQPHENAAASTSRQQIDSPGPSCSKDAGQPAFVEHESDEDSSADDEPEEEQEAEMLGEQEMASDEDEVTSTTALAVDRSEQTDPSSQAPDNSCPDVSSSTPTTELPAEDLDKTKDALADEHPIQIQQWLRQILAETETEPIVHEIGRPIVGQFAKLPSAARLYREFPVET